MQNNKLKIGFFGTPNNAAKTLETLINSDQFEISFVVTQPDKLAGRGKKLTPSPVKALANLHHLPCLQPATLKGIKLNNNSLICTNEDLESHKLADLINTTKPDIFIVVAFGQIIPRDIFTHPKYKTLNIHYSLLPRWRGAAPVQRAIEAGDLETGVSIMEIDEGLDTGPIYSTDKIAILEDDTFSTLLEKLTISGSELLISTLKMIVSEAISPEPQPISGATHAKKWDKSESKINWSSSARAIKRKINAVDFGFCEIEDKKSKTIISPVKIFKTKVIDLDKSSFLESEQEDLGHHDLEQGNQKQGNQKQGNSELRDPGYILSTKELPLAVKTGEGLLQLLELQLPSKNRITAEAFINSYNYKDLKFS